MDLYAENILHHYKNPIGKIEDETKFDCCHRELNPSCGDEITACIKFDDDKINIGWKGTGCAVSQSAISMLCEIWQENPPTEDDLLKFSKEDMLEILNVPVSNKRMKCALLGMNAVKNALQNKNN
ncbi:MAG: iron-sulfur cluster assembly scaffold protein [Candidatus Peribacteraceae bacterium]|nr:iron-sulfur cluster assembly scaffold protein [Candidatus Peribacteraceae bacterium]